MEAWKQVKVKNEKLEHHGRAGVVREPGETEGTSNVLLDGESELLEFNDSDLQVLG